MNSTGSIRIPVSMHSLITPKIGEQISHAEDNDPFCDTVPKQNYFGPSMRWLLAAVLDSLNLTRMDEIAILSTSNEDYIPICVSVTAYNYGKISRVVTCNTKVIILIHEYGYVFPDIAERIFQWKKIGIHVIEDCATLIGLDINNKKIGSFGDYALFSLPKIFPTPSGGLLRTTKKLSLAPLSEELNCQKKEGECAAEKYLTKFMFFNNRRMDRVTILKDGGIKPSFIFEPSQLSVPYQVGLLTNKKNIIEKNIPNVGWGATLRPDILYVPTNPLVEEDSFRQLISNELLRSSFINKPHYMKSKSLKYFQLIRTQEFQ